MDVLITGSTGMVGKSVLNECINDDRIGKIYLINRVPVNLNCSKTVQPEGKNYIDGAYSNTTGIAFLIKAYGESAPVEGYGESP